MHARLSSLVGQVICLDTGDQMLVVVTHNGQQTFLAPSAVGAVIFGALSQGAHADDIFEAIQTTLQVSADECHALCERELAPLDPLYGTEHAQHAPVRPNTPWMQETITLGPRPVVFRTNDPRLHSLITAIAPPSSGASDQIVSGTLLSDGVFRVDSPVLDPFFESTLFDARSAALTALVATSYGADIPLLHGALLRSPKGDIILLGGDSGQGKSTLALGLSLHGFDLLSDDIAAFDPVTGKLRPIPMASSVKEGAWPLFKDSALALRARTSHQIGDRTVKYVPLPEDVDRTAFHKIDKIILPKWGASETGLTPVPHSFELIFEILKWSRVTRDQKDMQAMVDMLRATDVFELAYGSFEGASGML